MPPSNRCKTPRPAVEDPVEVFCRLKPISPPDAAVCCKMVDESTVSMVPDNINYKFTKVFDENSGQGTIFDDVVCPLVEDLVHAKNGLLFTYGITGSGKTYTMSGSSENPGLLPRALDMIFNSIQGLQTDKYTFQPDNQNGFRVQSDADRMLDRQKDVLQFSKNAAETRRYLDRAKGSALVRNVDEYCRYSVFVSFIEVYNNNVYDLLEDLPFDPITGNKPPQTKVLREDDNHIMYVHGLKEVQVNGTEEAFAVLYKGNKRRKVAHTTLNAESSRSHSVFTIRLVQGPLNENRSNVLDDSSEIQTSQLSLVDLAGSERTTRAKTAGDRLKEASQINNSLMTLRTCIDVLRENQKAAPGTPHRFVPYRDSKITHLFKSYFDGEGKVRMVLCVNPSMTEHKETVHVMKFAEAAQEVKILRSHWSTRSTPRRRPAAPTFSDLDALSDQAISSLGSLPSSDVLDAHDADTLPKLMAAIEKQRKLKQQMKLSFTQKADAFRERLLVYDKDHEEVKRENGSLKRENGSLKRENGSLRNENNSLKRKYESLEADLKDKVFMCERQEKRLKVVERERDQYRLAASRSVPTSTIPSDLPTPSVSGSDMDTGRTGQQDSSSEMDTGRSTNRFQTPRRQGASVFQTPRPVGGTSVFQTPRSAMTATPRYAQSTRSSRFNVADNLRPTARSAVRPTKPSTVQRPRARSPPPVMAKPDRVLRNHHRRSQSAGPSSERWLDHRPPSTMGLDTVLQPSMKKKKSVTQLNIKDTKESSKYMLTHQQLDKKGNVRTDLIKGAVIPTAGGGSSVVFTGVETLRERSPGAGNKPYVSRKPSDYDGDWTDTENRCKVAIEGHGQLQQGTGVGWLAVHSPTGSLDFVVIPIVNHSMKVFIRDRAVSRFASFGTPSTK